MININNEANSFAEYQEIEKTIMSYVDGGRKGNGKLATSSFYDQAHLIGSIGGDFYNMTKEEFVVAVDSGVASDGFKFHIASIDISGPAASARVEFINWNGLRFTDFFVLYKQDGVWKISAKVYDSHSNN